MDRANKLAHQNDIVDISPAFAINLPRVFRCGGSSLHCCFEARERTLQTWLAHDEILRSIRCVCTGSQSVGVGYQNPPRQR